MRKGAVTLAPVRPPAGPQPVGARGERPAADAPAEPEPAHPDAARCTNVPRTLTSRAQRRAPRLVRVRGAQRVPTRRPAATRPTAKVTVAARSVP